MSQPVIQHRHSVHSPIAAINHALACEENGFFIRIGAPKPTTSQLATATQKYLLDSNIFTERLISYGNGC